MMPDTKVRYFSSQSISGVFTALLILFSLTACGGSGGGGVSEVSPLTYRGNTNPAIINPQTAAILVDISIGEETATNPTNTPLSASISPASQRYVSSTNIVSRLQRALKQTLPNDESDISSLTIAALISDTNPCTDGGTRSFSGDVNPDSTGVFDVNYNNCREGDVTFNGSGIFRIDAFDRGFGEITDGTITFTRLNMSNPDCDSVITGSFRIETLFYSRLERVTTGIVYQCGGRMGKIENYVTETTYDNIFTPSNKNESFSGRLYDSEYGYLDITTPSVWRYSDVIKEVPDLGGETLLVGDSGKSILVSIIDDVWIQVELNLDGDLLYEISSKLMWTDLSAETGSDLGDADNDGMHDSWEVVQGFDPTDGADAFLDPDGDGINNVGEYEKRTDPNDSTSYPPTADLSIIITESTDPAFVGGTMAYTLSVTNNGPDNAENAVVVETLPAEATLLSVSASQGICTGTTTIECQLGVINNGGTVLITVNVAVTSVVSAANNNASVSSDAYDNNSSDDSAISVTTFMMPVADLGIKYIAPRNIAAVAHTIRYQLAVTNHGPAPSENVVVSNTLPSGVSLASANVSPSLGACSGSTIISCNLGNIENGDTVMVIIDAIIDSPENAANNIASVVSNNVDSNSLNNSVVAITKFIFPGPSIQSLIDAASDGDTVFIGPGIYMGPLSFVGKNVRLESTDGPENTIIDGDRRKAITIGPLSAIVGFTVANVYSTSGAIEVNGAGTLLSGNIIDGNTTNFGGFGVGIYSGSGSPTIEHNIFRNNVCNDQSTAGVLSFSRDSSPIIMNNIFENNLCMGIDLNLYVGSNPVIMNNTFIGNDIGVRIGRFWSSATEIYRNNIIVQNGVGVEARFGDESDNPVWENNLVYGNTVDYFDITDQTGLNGNISSDPLFVDVSNKDYHLQAGSPAIDSGSDTNAPVVDFDGATRPIDGNADLTPATDIGAYEYQ